ncbi:MAG: SDR family oxidoreductase [Cyanobacteria bacterium P01_E01_bin.6]
MNHSEVFSGNEIAVIGISGRFPGAKNLEKFWQNLKDGRSSISFFTDEELKAAGVTPAALDNSNYVKAGSTLEEIELFDASFFNISPREAEIIDPQHRLFLECAWEALEDAGYNPENYSGRIGVYAGVSRSYYFMYNLSKNRNALDSLDPLELVLATEKDYLVTRVSYKLNLKGPGIVVQGACATSLIAIHLACQSLLNGESDINLAGGVTIASERTGYYYQDGGILSPDGHCRVFDAKAQGTIPGNGLGIVVLKRLEDALAEGDSIHAVIKGSAVNNDGSVKVGYTAPSVNGQASVIAEALAVSEVDADTVTYVETHGTGTPLGDPIEIAALTQAFRAYSNRKGYCAVGSLKSNVGHMDSAAGVGSLIKTVLALKHRLIPSSLNFDQPNPNIDFTNSPFYVNTTLTDWETNGMPRRAGVSSFGFGGTNAHAILQEAPIAEESGASRPWQLFVVSAKTNSALETATANLADHFKRHPNLNCADVAYTLQIGRKAFKHRRILVCQNAEDAIQALETPQQRVTSCCQSSGQSLVFMFPGQGAQYVNMAKDLYETEPNFTAQVDQCCSLLTSHLGLDLRSILYPDEAQAEAAQHQLKQTQITQSALFVISYALAKLWMSWGIHPTAMIGHSIGEYVAACLAGVFSLEDALRLVAVRGRMMQEQPSGSMLSVNLPASKVDALLAEGLSLASSNSPSRCVVSGSVEAIEAFRQQLATTGIDARCLQTSHAFHSQSMDSILEPFAEHIKTINLNAPKIPFISNVTGTWIKAEDATDPSYWATHLRQPVLFSEGIQELLKEPDHLLLEVGPGRTLCTLVKQQSHLIAERVVLSSLRHPQEHQSDVAFLLLSLGRLWLAGVNVDWSGFSAQEQRHRVPLPTYPFERQRHWISPDVPDSTHAPTILNKNPDIGDWFYLPSWQRSIPPGSLQPIDLNGDRRCWLVFTDECGIAANLVKRLKLQNQAVVQVMVGETFAQVSADIYTLNPRSPENYAALIAALVASSQTPQIIAHLWSVTNRDQVYASPPVFEQAQHLGYYSLLYLAQALGNHHLKQPIQIGAISSNMQEVIGEKMICPEKASILGPCTVIPQEYSHIACRSIDIALPLAEPETEQLIDLIIAELLTSCTDAVVAYRGQHRWSQTFESIRLEATPPVKTRLRSGGVYVITGGLGGVGLAVATHLARTVKAKLVLLSRSDFPHRHQWQQWIDTHDSSNQVSDKIRQLQAIEALGAEVLIVNADVTDLAQMQAVVEQASQRFGQIHGVFHTAGIPGGGLIQLKTPETVTGNLAPKGMGTLVLDAVFKDIPLDFLVLFSSHGSFRSAFGQVDYCAANAFLDAFAHYKRFNREGSTVSVNWDRWQSLGMAVDVEARHKALTGEDLPAGMNPEEGVEALSRILAINIPQIVVSTYDFLERITQQNAVKTQADAESLENANLPKSLHSRPELNNTYVAPRDAIEQAVTEIWQECLGIEQIGIYDDFFELGGDSLLALSLVASLRKSFKLDLPLNELFNASNPAALSQVIVANEAKPGQTEKIAQVLHKIRGMSDEAIKQALELKKKGE